MPLRRVLFWSHLVAGVSAGVVILLMSLTGVALMYERQILAWADSGYRSNAPSPSATRLPLESVVERMRTARPDVQPSALTVRSDADAPVTVAAGQRTFYVDAYRGTVVGEASRTGARAAMSTLREWHRWLAMSGDERATGRAITGWSTLVFLGIVCSGIYLWLPKRWAWQNVRAVVLFRPGLQGKARDFNWHNVIGIWSAVPLFFVVLSALPISFPWANAAVYHAVGENPPPPPARPATTNEELRTRTRNVEPGTRNLEVAFARAAREVQGWRSIAVRLPASPEGYVFTIDRGDGGQPHLRDTLTVAASGQVVKFEPFSSQTLGRRLRSISRFTHTGEVLGLAGQTVAGMVSAGAVVLVWTGLALAYRRIRAAIRSPWSVVRKAPQRATDYGQRTDPDPI